MAKMINGIYSADFSNCTTEAACQSEFYQWAYDVCMGKFCTDKGIVYNKAQTEQLYEQEKDKNPRYFHAVSNASGTIWYYYGTDKDLLKRIKETKKARDAAIKNIKVRTTVSTGKDPVTEAYYTNNYNKYNSTQRSEIKAVASQIESGTLTGQAKKTAIDELNKKYNLDINENSTPKEIRTAANATTTAVTYKLSEAARTDAQKIVSQIQSNPNDSNKTNQMINEWNSKYGKEAGITIPQNATAQKVTNVMNSSTRISATQEIGNQLTEDWIKTRDTLSERVQTGIQTITGTRDSDYTLSADARSSLKKIIDAKNNGTMDEKAANEAIYTWNQTYGKAAGVEISGTASAKEIKDIMNKKKYTGTGGIFGQVEQGIKGKWDNSTNADIQKYTQAGITADVLWGVVTGKYNKDAQCKKDLDSLAADIQAGKLTDDQKKQRLDELRKKYPDLANQLPDDVSAEQLAKIVQDNKSFEYNRTVNKITRDLIEQKLNTSLANALEDKLGSKLKEYGINFSFKDRNLIQDIRDIIRGHKYVKFNQASFLKGLQEQLQKRIDKLIEDQVNKRIDEYTEKINSKIDSIADKVTGQLDTYREKVDAIQAKLDSWESVDTKLQIANKLDQMISAPVDKIANILNAPTNLLAKWGINVPGLGDMFKKITGDYTKDIAGKIQSKFAPLIQKASAIVAKVSAAIKNAINYVNKMRDTAKQLVQKWANQLKNYVAQQTKVLVNEITKFVKLNIAGLGSGFSI